MFLCSVFGASEGTQGGSDDRGETLGGVVSTARVGCGLADDLLLASGSKSKGEEGGIDGVVKHEAARPSATRRAYSFFFVLMTSSNSSDQLLGLSPGSSVSTLAFF